MFSDSRASPSGEQKGFKPHAPHFLPWLRNSLKSHHGGDVGLKRPQKSTSEVFNTLTPLERPKGIGFFSFSGKERSKKSDLRWNGVSMAKMLPVMLRGPHILHGTLGKQREDSPVRWNQSPELAPAEGPGEERRHQQVNSSTAAEDDHAVVRNHSGRLSVLHPQKDRTCVPLRKYGPLVAAVSVTAPLAQDANYKVPVGVCVEDGRAKAWDYTNCTTFRRGDVHSSSWASPETQGLIERQRRLSSSFSYVQQRSRNSQSQRDLTALREPPVEGLSRVRPANGVIFSTEVPQQNPGCTKTLRRPRRPRPSSEHIAVLDGDREPQSCSRKAVRNQIKRVMDNLEQVLTALRDVHQEMKEVVHQIDTLTSSIDMDEPQRGFRGGDSSPVSSPSTARSGSTRRRVSQPESSSALRRDQRRRSSSPPGLHLCPASSGVSPERSQTCAGGSSPGNGGPEPNAEVPSPGPARDLVLLHQKTLPVRPPTPGLSPLTVNLHPPSSSIGVRSASPPSPLSSEPHPPPALGPSVIIETKVASNQTSLSDHLSAGLLSTSSTQPPSAGGPPTDSDMQNASNTNAESEASAAGPLHPASRMQPTAAQGRRGRKPPPYPHRGPSEHTKKTKETRKAPPYPEKRRLLSTTV